MGKVRKKKVLFLCTHNSARSQMAEGLLRALYGDRYEAFSAGTHPSIAVNPFVVKAMNEIGLDLSGHHPKGVRDLGKMNFDYVITVCNDAKEACPFYYAEKVLHENFPDPSEFMGSDEKILDSVREVRDQIKAWIIEKF